MNNSLRKHALINIAARKSDNVDTKLKSVLELYGKDVFSLKTMKDFLSKPVYQSLLATISKGESLNAKIADEVANAMKCWAISKGASHYTHWFQPLTGSTAEKHDSFIEPDHEGGVVLNFSGETLIKGEPDASSFPSGGLRATFEARGYTAWDPTSPAFIKKGNNNATLCIPTAFYSYTGEALDKKTPLLRAMKAISDQAKRLLKCFGEEVEGKVHSTLGVEQEYFLIDKEMYFARPDLIQCERTLFGKVPPKHQQLEDHYFGNIKPRVLCFMTDVDEKLWRLGIPAKTRHNEVAPSQFEIAAQYEELNLAVDHNMMIMETLREVANKHGFVCMIHEKPYEGINGSGKHNNWSISANGRNLLNPGHSPHEDAIFLTVLCAVIKAVDKHADIFRSSVACAGNAHRLGGNEAPPAIISMFLGDQLMDIIEQLERGAATSTKYADIIRIGVDTLPELPKDVSDRNRTSPFAFTGNKFEFRAVGSSQSCADPNIVLNTIVAEAFDEIASNLEGVNPATEKFNAKLQGILTEIIRKHKRIIFNGDNYSQEWVVEAERRGLPNIIDIPESLESLVTEKSIRLFSNYNVLSEVELHSRYEVFIEEYSKVIAIEGEMGLDIAKTMIFPAALKYQTAILDNLAKTKSLELNAGLKSLNKKSEKLGGLIDNLSDRIETMEQSVLLGVSKEIIKSLKELRFTVDELEAEVDDSVWPLTKYSEMLFLS
jgi:glutamine synthetase